MSNSPYHTLSYKTRNNNYETLQTKILTANNDKRKPNVINNNKRQLRLTHRLLEWVMQQSMVDWTCGHRKLAKCQYIQQCNRHACIDNILLSIRKHPRSNGLIAKKTVTGKDNVLFACPQLDAVSKHCSYFIGIIVFSSLKPIKQWYNTIYAKAQNTNIKIS